MPTAQSGLLDPVATTKAIEDALIRYITTTLPFADSTLREQFKESLRDTSNPLVKGPYIEATPPFRKASYTYAELIEQDFLCPGFRRIHHKDYFPLERAPYLHQFKAFRKLIKEKRNVVLATGTGSGKTEAFMVPIVDYLLRQCEARQLGPGVRALLLYPMNALANDQLSRLRELLCNVPEITFGRYTGDTEQDPDKARDQYRKEHGHRDHPFPEPLPNELLSREEMHHQPPHILITNYAMLEYLLLRPKASPLFEYDTWHFVVLDEAHVYDGAKGIEIGMLLRRLKDRVVRSEPGRLQCVATSATLSREETEGTKKIAEFAAALFEENFGPEDVITGATVPLRDAQTTGEWRLPLPAYLPLAEAMTGKGDPPTAQELRNICIQTGVPDEALLQAFETASPDVSRNRESAGTHAAPDNAERSSRDSNLDIGRFLHALLSRDSNVLRLQEALERERVQDLQKLANEVFPDTSTDRATRAIAALIDLAARARLHREDVPLLPARYHVFVRALEGAYVRLWPMLKLFLSPREREHVNGTQVEVFEAAVCTNCGALYLVGQDPSEMGDSKLLKQLPLGSAEYIGYRAKLFLYDPPAHLLDKEENEDEDVSLQEQDSSASAGGPEKRFWWLCKLCGALVEDAAGVERRCRCGDSAQWVRLLEAETSKDDTVRRCAACGVRSQQRPTCPLFPNGPVAAAISGSDNSSYSPTVGRTRPFSLHTSSAPTTAYCGVGFSFVP